MSSPALAAAAAAVAQDADERLTPRETAALARVAEKTLANWRSLGVGPPYTKLTPGRGGRIRYRRGDVLAWLKSGHSREAA